MSLPSQQNLKDYIELSPVQRVEYNRDLRRSFLLFFAYYYAEAITYPFAAFHSDFADDLADLEEGIITELCWCTARETAKSAMASGYLLWRLANVRDDYSCVDSADRSNSEGFLFDVINTMQTNERFITDYGKLFARTSTEGEKTRRKQDDFQTVNDYRVTAHSCEEPFRGRRHKIYIRPGLVIFDDFELLKTVRSEAATRAVAEHISEGTGGLDQKRGRRLYLCNWLSDTANVASIKSRSLVDPKCRFREVWRVDKETGLPTWPERDVLTDDDLLDPANSNKVSIETKRRGMWNKDTGDADWMREMQGEPLDPMGDGPDRQGFVALFPKDQRRITNSPFTKAPPYAIGVDPSGEGKDTTAIVVRSAFEAFVWREEKVSTPKGIALLVAKAMDEFRVDQRSVIVDAFGIGFKCVQELAMMGRYVKAVNVGEKEHVKALMQESAYLNDRALAYVRLKDWMTAGGSLCYHEKWDDELKCIRIRVDEHGRRQIISKREIIKRGFRSPNICDATALSCLADLSARSGPVRTADDEPVSSLLG